MPINMFHELIRIKTDCKNSPQENSLVFLDYKYIIDFNYIIIHYKIQHKNCNNKIKIDCHIKILRLLHYIYNDDTFELKKEI